MPKAKGLRLLEESVGMHATLKCVVDNFEGELQADTEAHVLDTLGGVLREPNAASIKKKVAALVEAGYLIVELGRIEATQLGHDVLDIVDPEAIEKIEARREKEQHKQAKGKHAKPEAANFLARPLRNSSKPYGFLGIL